MDNTSKPMKIRLTGYIDVPAHRMDAVQVGLAEHIRLTHAEAGCVSFTVTPSADIKGRFEIAEVFVDRAAFDAHQVRAAASAWAKVSKGIPRDYKIEEID